MRETRSSGSVEGVMGNHDSYSDSYAALTPRGANPRSPVAQTTCRVRQPSDFPIAGQSFHIV
jgi:hypothetical protein